MTKFDLLNRRFVMPCSIVIGNEKRFPGVQEFFKDFLRSAENSFFYTHVQNALVHRIISLDNFEFSCEVAGKYYANNQKFNKNGESIKRYFYYMLVLRINESINTYSSIKHLGLVFYRDGFFYHLEEIPEIRHDKLVDFVMFSEYLLSLC